MSTASHKDYCLSKYKDQDVSFLVNRKLTIHKQLERPPRTHVVYTDLHGSYEKYLYWLKNGMGYYQIAISEILGGSYSERIYKNYERLFLFVNRTRINTIAKYIEEGGKGKNYNQQSFFKEAVPKKFIKTVQDLEELGLSKTRIIEDVLKVLRLITRGDEHRIFKTVPRTFLENMLKLYFKEDRDSYRSMMKGIVETDKVFYITLSIVIKVTLNNMFDKHINIGDTFDRGNDADKLIEFYQAFFGPATNVSPLHYIWGNHDILWMGASIGNPILAITALRISLRYNNIAYLYRYGFNLDKLRSFALECYKETPTGAYIKEKKFDNLSEEEAVKMTKVLHILEAKMTIKCLNEALKFEGDIDYNVALNRYLKLLDLLPTGIKEDRKEWEKFQKQNPLYSDVYFPTIDPKDPHKLTAKEQEIVGDIVSQFTTLPALQNNIHWLFEKGETYRVVDNTVYYHAALPATEDMDLAEVKGLKGKKLLDFIQRDLKRIAEHHRDGETLTVREKMLFWHLWCGANSPFFCKSKMATFERAFFNKEEAAKSPLTTWKEDPNPYYHNIRNDLFLNKLLTEFHADKICMGHTPMKTLDKTILSNNLRAFIVDGGASHAYGDRGVILINTPDYNYLTQHPSLEELKKAEEEDRLANIQVTPLEEKKHFKLRHMDKGYFLRRELEAIDELINAKIDNYCERYFYS